MEIGKKTFPAYNTIYRKLKVKYPFYPKRKFFIYPHTQKQKKRKNQKKKSTKHYKNKIKREKNERQRRKKEKYIHTHTKVDLFFRQTLSSFFFQENTKKSFGKLINIHKYGLSTLILQNGPLF